METREQATVNREQELREKVIEELSKFREELRTCNSTTYVSGARVVMRMDLIDMAIDLLKGLEPVAPVRKDGLYRCGNCLGTVVGYIADFSRRLIKTDNYCRKCGREVKW